VRRWILLEGGVLSLAAPFLLVPELFPTVTTIALIALVAVWLLTLRATPLPPTAFNLAFLPWGLVFIVGILVSADPSETLSKAMGLILGLAVWRYVVIAPRNRRHVLLAVAFLLVLCVGFSLIGVFGLQEVPKIPLLGRINPFSARSLPGLGSVAIHPNQLAGLICLYLPLLISLLAVLPSGVSPRFRFILVPTVLLTLFILLLTQSRGGWVSAVLGLFVLLALWALVMPQSGARRALRVVVLVVILGGIVAAVWIGPEQIRDLWLNPPAETAIGTFSTLNYRKELWPWAVTAIEDFPFTGVGLGTFKLVVFRLYPVPIAADHDIGHAHNIFLQTALDLGLPGLVVYLAILFIAAAVGLRVARRDAGFRSISLGLLAGLAALHIFGLADALALGAKPGLIFWFVLGLLAAMNKRGVSTTAERVG
jgi:putative inorganic carbon (HCO3(-)) transporter